MKTEFAPPGRHRTAAAFRAHWRSQGDDFDCALLPRGAAGPLGSAFTLFGRTLSSRFAVQPMEGWDAEENGLPSPLTLRRWRRFGRSGAPLLFGGEAFAVREDGRANPRQLFMNPREDVLRGLSDLLIEWRAGRREAGTGDAAAVAGLQLTHSGRFARPSVRGTAPLRAAAHPVLDARFGIPKDLPLLSDGELEAIGEGFVRAASLAACAGFDFVDVKCCHGYLLHELLGAKTRAGSYGGSFENRTRFFRRVVAAIRAAEPTLGIAVRVSLGDVFPHSADPATGIGAPFGFDRALAASHGFGVGEREPDYEEGIAFLGVARACGIRLVNVTLGSPYYCPHVQRPAFYPPSDGYLPPEDPLQGVARHVRAARRAKAAFPDLAVVGTGYSYLQEWVAHVAEHEIGAGHVDFAGLGRSMLSYPELPLDVLAGRALDRKKICRTFSDCTTAPRNGLRSGCYPLDDAYGALPDAAILREKKKARPR
jgi:2,4-dienoyl-CoA reductase-like NADH-dependent reductase (Old Yellow Enzyme family)